MADPNVMTPLAVNAAMTLAGTLPPLESVTLGVPTIDAVIVSPTSRSFTGNVPLMGAKSWAEALANSTTGAG